MSDADLLKLLKMELDYLPNNTARDELFSHYLAVSKKRLAEMGVEKLNMDSIDDCHLIIEYAAYMYNYRKTQEGLPRHLQFAIHNRIVGGAS